jgi:hypothetical protein
MRKSKGDIRIIEAVDTQEEKDLEVRDGSDKLEELFDQNGVTELLPSRQSVVLLM